jgi:fructose-bisphosphate aldolase class II
MPLVSMKELLDRARTGAYAVGMFDFYSLESLEAIFDAAEQLGAPVIVGIVTPLLHRVTAGELVRLACSMAQRSSSPAAVHLDHGRDFDTVIRVMAAGATSVMYDGSSLPVEENIENTAQIVRAAASLGVSTEAELGYVPGAGEEAGTDETSAVVFTDPKEAGLFVARTGVDALAIAVGNAHGIYRSAPQLDFRRIGEIRENTEAHLVLHGASGIPPEDIRRAIDLGVRKVNFFTEVACATHALIREIAAEHPVAVPFYRFLPELRTAIRTVVQDCITTLGSAGKR